MENIKLYDAIAEMRKFTEKGENFSIMFMSYDRGKNVSHGITEIKNAKLRAQTTIDKNIMTNYMLNIINVDTNECRRCYQPLIMMFNNKKIELT